MTDVAYLGDNCDSLPEVESVRENLILDLCTAGSYELSGQPGMLDPRARFLRRRIFRGLAWALGPGIRIIHVRPGAVGGCRGRPRPYLIALSLAGQQRVATTRAQRPSTALEGGLPV
jgi:hypothetical protein